MDPRRRIIGIFAFFLFAGLAIAQPPVQRMVNINNEGATGTTLNKLAKLTGAPSTAIISGAGDTSGALGVVIAGAGTTGQATIQEGGESTCVFDGATTAGHYIQISASVAGDCHDAGATFPTSGGQVIGVVLSTNASGGTYSIDMSLRQASLGATAGVASVNTLTGSVVLFGVNAQTSTYQVLASDFSGCKTITVASGTFTITLVASGSQPPSGQCIDVINYGSGGVTIARSGQNINGGTSSLTLVPASATAPTWSHVVSDGTNYEASLAGTGITGSVTSVNTLTGAVVLFSPKAESSNYQVLAADFAGCRTIYSSSGSFTITLVASGSQPPAGQCIDVVNYGVGALTIARSGQNLNGGTASIIVPSASATTPTWAHVVSDGTNYVATLAGSVSSVNTLTGNVTLFTTNAQTSTYQVTAADFSACATITVASGTFTITLVPSGINQPPSGQCVDVINYGSGVVTIARSGQNINGGTASLTLAAASATAPTWAHVVSDGTNYEAALAISTATIPTNDTRRGCDIAVGDTSGSAITNAQLGPQKRICFIPAASTIIEVDVAADAGTPNVIVGNDNAGSVSNIVSSALATAAAGGIACSNTGGTTGLDGATTCSATLQNTTLAVGSYLELVSGTAGGTAKFMTIHVIYTIN